MRRLLKQGHAIVIDVGKTLSKVSLWTRDGHCLDKQTRPNTPQANNPYAPLDSCGVAAWLVDALKSYAGQPVEAIIPVAHGAAVVGLRAVPDEPPSEVLAFAPPDYEWEIPASSIATYRNQRDPFSVTGSPVLPAGLNLGSQLHYLESLDPAGFSQATLLPYAQYFAFLLSGVAVSEVSSLGCHSDLWSPCTSDYSPMAKRRGWAKQFAPLARASDVIGTLRPDLAEQTGLPRTAQVYAGLHDSNAALLAARGFPEIAGQEATILSTGTWFIAMRSGGAADQASLSETRDCLINVDVLGQPVPSARYMGGREIEVLGHRVDHAGTAGYAEALTSGAMLLPSQLGACGPFPDAEPCWIAEPADPAERGAAIALYAALMTDVSLDLIGARDTLLIEGRFSRSELFTRALAALRPQTTAYRASAEADVSFGALRLFNPELAPAQQLERVIPLEGPLSIYKQTWRRRAEQRT